MDSNVIIWVVVAIIVLAAILYLVGYFLKKSNKEKLDALEERKIALFDLPVIEELDDVKKMHLVGQSQNTFREWNQKWQELSTTSFANFEGQLFEAESLNDTFHLFKVKDAITEVGNSLTTMETEVATIRQGIKELAQSEENNSLAVQQALDIYDELKQDSKENGQKYGPALPELKKQLKNTENKFNTFVSLNTSGDPIEARDVLEEAEKKTYEMQEIMGQIPDKFALLHETYPGQMDEIKETFNRLTKEQYVFPDDALETKIKNVDSHIKSALKDLEKIEIDSVDTANVQIEGKIDELYDELEKEMKAKIYVDENQIKLKEYIQHAEGNNHQLLIELDHVSQSYTLTKNELGRTRGFQGQIEEVTRQYNELEPKLTHHEVPYSQVVDFYQNTYDLLADIESQQVDISQGLVALREGEKEAQEKIDDFEFKLRNLKRYVEKQRLPGLPGDYLEFFFVATDHVEDLSKELNKIRINMEDVNRLVNFCEDDLRVLEEKTHDLVDSAALTEQMMQYANRYRFTNDSVKMSIEKALNLFSKDYRYQDALDEIGTTLERVEPGAVKRIESFYYDHQDQY